ncbi:phosphatase PAP2 family protein [Halomicroarcula limicola]|uniref:Phosphatase PAP2 family protein n=1 Tax=Haloarcula limicola TaxID=1429915 RepID=A0A8J7Y3V8_9EURY|nr:phosphatase PAP2 family protein [Halomicroarcula limicola]MBV0923900.1 phosphatase PAP2 family protein [Halomicroarcula limicola]
MSLATVLAEVVVVVATALSLASVAVVGPEGIRAAAADFPQRLRDAARPLAVLGAMLALNSVVRDVGVELSWLIGLNITDTIYAIEGSFVAALQSLMTPWSTPYFGYVYIYGYVFLLVFPILLGIFADDDSVLRRTALAYTVNYGGGILCYLLFVAYGPRNYMPELVEPLLFDTLPRFQLLTSRVNANTNVFPSLHTSLSVTVALLSVHTRERFPRWTPVAVFLAASVVLSTMILGIHWGTDVVAGALLGALAVRVATRSRFR